jgi:transposase InsO family protein
VAGSNEPLDRSILRSLRAVLESKDHPYHNTRPPEFQEGWIPPCPTMNQLPTKKDHQLVGQYAPRFRKLQLCCPLLWLNISNGDLPFRGLIDSASSINLISPIALESFRSIPLTTYKVSLQGITGTSKGMDKWHLVDIIFPNGSSCTIPMLEGLDESIGILLGMPFLEQIGATINIKSRMLHTKYGSFGWGSYRDHRRLPSTLISLPTAIVEKGSWETILTPERQKELNAAIQNANLSEATCHKLRRLLEQYQALWASESPGLARGTEFTFDLTDYKPIRLPPRVIPQRWHEEVERQCAEMVEQDVLEPSISPYCTYPVLVPKKDGGIRFAIDYRKLNSVTIPDKTPLPRPENLYAAIRGSSYFILMDLRSGFWHIPVKSTQRHFTAFSTHHGHWQFKRMPYGVINGPPAFQRWMNHVFSDLAHEGVLTYIDDILIHAPTEEDLLLLFGEVLHRMEKSGQRIKLSKCEFNPKSFDYLGHVVEGSIKKPQGKKLLKFKLLKAPTDQKQLRSVLGTLSYYRMYVPHFSELAEPITRLVRKGATVKWGPEQQEAYEKITRILDSATLQLAPLGERYRLETDASDVAVGAVLYDLDFYERTYPYPLPLMFLSKKFNSTQQRWSTAEREAYAILWALEATQAFTKGREVHVYSDHKNLPALFKSDKGKIARWAIRLSEFNPLIHYVKGKENIVADFLSRYVEDLQEPDKMFCCIGSKRGRKVILQGTGRRQSPFKKQEDSRPSTRKTQDISDKILDPSYNLQLDFDGIEVVEKRDVNLHETPISIYHFLEGADFPSLEEILEQQRREPPPAPLTKSYFRDSKGRIGYLTGLWIPPSLRLRILDSVHLQIPLLHPGQKKMMTLLKRMYCWPGMHDDVRDYLESCLFCQRTRPRFINSDYQYKPHPMTGPFQHIYVDIWGPILWKDENFSLLTMIDNFTKWSEICVLRDTTAETIAQALFTQWISRFGAPRTLTTDNASVFLSRVMEILTTILGTKHLRTTIYHPDGNAPVERFHQALKKTFSLIRSTSREVCSIEEAVALTLLVYRTLPHTATGESPAFLTHGTNLLINNTDYVMTDNRLNPIEQNRLLTLATLRHELIRRYWYLRMIAERESNEDMRAKFALGELVIFRLTDTQQNTLAKKLGISPKLQSSWSLPMRVLQVNSTATTATVQCITSGYTTQVHILRTKKIKEPLTEKMKTEWTKIFDSESDGFKEMSSKFRHLEEQFSPSLDLEAKELGARDVASELPDLDAQGKEVILDSSDDELTLVQEMSKF